MTKKIPKKISDIGSGITTFTRKKIVELASDLKKEKVLTKKQFNLIKKDLILIEKDLKKVTKDALQEILDLADELTED